MPSYVANSSGNAWQTGSTRGSKREAYAMRPRPLATVSQHLPITCAADVFTCKPLIPAELPVLSAGKAGASGGTPDVLFCTSHADAMRTQCARTDLGTRHAQVTLVSRGWRDTATRARDDR